MDVEEGHRGGMFPEIGIRQTERSKSGTGFKGPGGENIKNYGQHILSVSTPEGFVRKRTGCRREKASGVGITHHPGWERLVRREE